jgi:signal transduction histidine kinase
VVVPSREPDRSTVPSSDQLRWPWLDPLLAAVVLIVVELAVLNARDRRGPLVLNLIVVAGISLATIWRRRSPVCFSVVALALWGVMTDLLSPRNHGLIGVFMLGLVLYTLGAWTDRRAAVVGLAVVVGAFTLAQALGRNNANVGPYTGLVVFFCAAWACGRAIRARRRITMELERTAARLAAEREDRARLAVAGERGRIARELHAAIARSVAAMVIQTEAASTLIDRDLAQADAAMDAIERSGRQALAKLRRVLGVLRRPDETAARTPQPGVDEIYALILRARELGQPVELSVDGDPGALPAGIELGLYRILDDALTSARRHSDAAVGVSLRFGNEDLELRLVARCHEPARWPTSTMRERVALCGGELRAARNDSNSWELIARLPRALQGALA